MPVLPVVAPQHTEGASVHQSVFKPLVSPFCYLCWYHLSGICYHALFYHTPRGCVIAPICSQTTGITLLLPPPCYYPPLRVRHYTNLFANHWHHPFVTTPLLSPPLRVRLHTNLFANRWYHLLVPVPGTYLSSSLVFPLRVSLHTNLFANHCWYHIHTWSRYLAFCTTLPESVSGRTPICSQTTAITPPRLGLPSLCPLSPG